jgi:hypothetical protein
MGSYGSAGGASGIFFSGVYVHASGTTQRVASSLLVGQIEKLKRTPS